jgi:DNA-binding transcriptional LysR family regulator
MASGLAVTLMPRLLAGELPGIRMLPLSSNAPCRRLYALTPEAGASDTAHAFIDAVEAGIRSRRVQTSSET